MGSLQKLYTLLFFLGLFFIPFNSFEGLEGLGEFRKESAAIFFLLAFIFLGISWLSARKIQVPLKSPAFLLIILFLLWICCSLFLNLDSVPYNFYKKTWGINRFLRQFFSIVISAIIFFLLYWDIISRMTIQEVLLKIRKGFLCSFIAVSIYSFFEILYVVFNIHSAYLILELFNYFPFTEFDRHMEGRISSVSYEPPFLAIYLITVAGWMFSYVVTHKTSIRFIPTILVIIITYYSGSRTALIVILIQTIVFFNFILPSKQKLYVIFGVAAITILSVTSIIIFKGDKIANKMEKKLESLNFKDNLKTNISNKSRFGIQYANFQVFRANPIAGIGFGQQGYHANDYYPLWAKKDNYEFELMYLNKNDPSFAPGYNLFIRILAEMGLIGMGIFILLLIYIYRNLKVIIGHDLDSSKKLLGIILFTSFVGFVLNWLQVDTFRIYGFWISIAISIKLFNSNERISSVNTTL